MDRTTVMLPSELKQRVACRSREMGVSFGEFVRLSLQDELSHRKLDCGDPLFTDTTVFSGQAPSNAAEAHDELLYGND